MRRTKAVGNVTHYYTYDGINLIREEWGNNTLVFLYDASGSPIGMQYRNSSYASGVWDTYYYEKNLQGDIIAVYNSSGTKLVTYTYDAWGYIISTTYSNGGASTAAAYNPLKYRGYYYDDDLDLYYLATRYYDPEVCRFITADSYVSTGQGILGYNRYAYCGNNPVVRVDRCGDYWQSMKDIISFGGSVIEVARNPTDLLNWAVMAGDIVDFLPYVTNVGETIKAIKTASKVVDSSQDVIAAAKAFRLANALAKSARSMYGSYEIVFQSGNIYIGKSGFDRAIFSAEEKSKLFLDEVESIRWKSSISEKESFIDEYFMQDSAGVFNEPPNVESYNKIWSPGRKYFYE